LPRLASNRDPPNLPEPPWPLQKKKTKKLFVLGKLLDFFLISESLNNFLALKNHPINIAIIRKLLGSSVPKMLLKNPSQGAGRVNA
jgi:hypothetical protein